MPGPRPILKCVVPVPRRAARLGLFLALLAATAGGYVLPASSILRRLSDARGELQMSNMRLDGTLTFSNSGAQDAAAALGGTGRTEVQVDGVFYLKLPGRCRFEASTPQGRRSAAIWSHGRERTEGEPLEELGIFLGQACPLLGIRSSSEAETRSAIDRHLRALKVDTRAVTLGRLAGEIAYVLGSSSEGQPQLWVYKDVFQPARIRWSDSLRRLLDVRFVDYGSALSGESFPRVMEMSRDGELLLRFTALRSDTKTALSDKLF
jgi:hypothetical protein